MTKVTPVIYGAPCSQARLDNSSGEEARNINFTRTAIIRGENFQTRDIDGQKFIDGYFAVFGSEYWLWDDAFETIDAGAFALDVDTDIRALTNHDTTLVLGRTTAGTLELRVDERGLFGTIHINSADQDAVNLYERVKRGDVNQCSFGFDILDQRMEIRDDGITVWHLMRVKLYEVSVVTFPAYEATGVEARKAELETINKRKLESWKAETINKLKGATDA